MDYCVSLPFSCNLNDPFEMDKNIKQEPGTESITNPELLSFEDKLYEIKCVKLSKRIEEYKLENEKLIQHIYEFKKLVDRYSKQKR